VNVANRTDGKHLALPMKDKNGHSRVVVIVKYTYRATPRGAIERDDEGTEPRAVDVPNGEDPAASSIRYPSDAFDFKPGTDVVLVGDAHPPPHPARGVRTFVDVSLRMGPIQKTVRAHGLRAWQRGLLGGVVPGPALPLKAPVPLAYELAWGGLDLSNPEKPLGEPRNYVGRGVSRDPKTLVGQAAAQLELAGSPLGERGNVPASFGPIHRHWAPRLGFAGTYDEAWQKTRMPLLPRDFDPRFHVCVPHDQWSPTPLRGDEPIEIVGATEDGLWRLALPPEAPRFSSLAFRERRRHPTFLDMVLVDARERRIELTWRASIPAPPKLESIDEIRIEAGAAS
jgi:hypothetical protein